MQRMALRKLEIEARHQMGSELFYTTKSGIMKFELWEARGYFVDISEEMREVKEDMETMRKAVEEDVEKDVRAAVEKHMRKRK